MPRTLIYSSNMLQIAENLVKHELIALQFLGFFQSKLWWRQHFGCIFLIVRHQSTDTTANQIVIYHLTHVWVRGTNQCIRMSPNTFLGLLAALFGSVRVSTMWCSLPRPSNFQNEIATSETSPMWVGTWLVVVVIKVNVNCVFKSIGSNILVKGWILL